MKVETTLKTVYTIAIPRVNGATLIEINNKFYGLDQLSQMKGNIWFDRFDTHYIYIKTNLQNLNISIES